MRPIKFCRELNSQQLLLETFFHIIDIFKLKASKNHPSDGVVAC